MSDCSHKFVDSAHCLRCGVSETQLLRKELASARAQFETVARTVRALEFELQYVRSHRDDNESAWQAEKQKREAAEARAAELEREMHNSHVQTEQVLRQRDGFAAAIAQARGLLECLDRRGGLGSIWHDRITAWLRAHPATAIPGVYEMPLDRERNKTAPFPAYVLGTPAAPLTRHTCMVTDEDECPECARAAKGAKG